MPLYADSVRGGHIGKRLLIEGGFGFLLVSADAVDDEGDGPVAGDVSSGAEAVHGNVNGNHQSSSS